MLDSEIAKATAVHEAFIQIKQEQEEVAHEIDQQEPESVFLQMDMDLESEEEQSKWVDICDDS